MNLIEPPPARTQRNFGREAFWFTLAIACGTGVVLYSFGVFANSLTGHPWMALIDAVNALVWQDWFRASLRKYRSQK